MGHFIDNYILPEDFAADEIKRRGAQMRSLMSGAEFIAGHDQGIGYRFFIAEDYSAEASRKAGIEIFKNEIMIEWLKSKRQRPVERVRLLPPSLLTLDQQTGEAIGGEYAESYNRFIKGQKTPGTPLSKWDVLDPAAVATLVNDGVFSVEQFAAMPRDRVNSRYPDYVKEHFDRAIQFVNGKDSKAVLEKNIAEMEALKKAVSSRDEELEALKAEIAKLSEKKSPGRPKKAGVQAVTE